MTVHTTELLKQCNLCPRQCGVNRLEAVGRCGAGSAVEISKIMLHSWEEPCISGTTEGRGSGAVFFTHCPLGCIFCQNRTISARDAVGESHSPGSLARRFMELQRMGAHNLNLVSPTHYTPQIIEAVAQARLWGMTLPVIWNTGGYERPETVEMLRNTVDIFLTDAKYASSDTAADCSHAPDYPDYCFPALRTMVDIAGSPAYDGDGMMIRGVILRHLVLPGQRTDSVEVLRRVAATVSPKEVVLSLMSQYTPEFLVVPKDPSPAVQKLRRRITSFEYDFVAAEAIRLGFDGYFQERSSATSRYTPEWG